MVRDRICRFNTRNSHPGQKVDNGLCRVDELRGTPGVGARRGRAQGPEL
jgi:hypothetical protein